MVKIDIFTKKQAEELIKAQLDKKLQLFLDKMETITHRINKLENKLDIWTNTIESTNKNQKNLI